MKQIKKISFFHLLIVTIAVIFVIENTTLILIWSGLIRSPWRQTAKLEDSPEDLVIKLEKGYLGNLDRANPLGPPETVAKLGSCGKKAAPLLLKCLLNKNLSPYSFIGDEVSFGIAERGSSMSNPVSRFYRPATVAVLADRILSNIYSIEGSYRDFNTDEENEKAIKKWEQIVISNQ